MSKTSGFTLIEILIIVAITGLLSVSVFSIYRGFNKNRSLEVSVQNIASLLSEARSLTLSSKNDSVYGVHLEESKAVLFKGTTYSTSSSDNIEYIISGLVSATSTLNGGVVDVVFDRLTGETTAFGTTTLWLTADASSTKNIIIRETGIIEFE